MSPLEFKLVAAAVVFAVGYLAGLAPTRLGDTPRGRRLFALGNAMAGGVFLGAGLIHMLGDSVAALESVWAYPVAFLLAAVGVTALLLMDRVLLPHGDAAAPGSAAAGAFTAYVLALILSIHSIIAGLSLGLEATIAGAGVIFVAIIAHKGSAAFALGISLQRGGVAARPTIRLFALMTPLGILLGAIGSHYLTGPTSRLLEGIFDGLAAGTFLYVAVAEIVDKEFATAEAKYGKFLLFAVGLSIMALLAIWT